MNLISLALDFLSGWQKYLLYAAVVLALCAISYVKGCTDERVKSVAFKAQVEALGKEAEKRKVEKEAQDAKQIKDALSERDAALVKLRQRPSPRSLPSNTAPASASGYVCLPTATYNSAMGEFRKSLERGMADARGNAEQGDAAQIDAEALLSAWPSR